MGIDFAIGDIPVTGSITVTEATVKTLKYSEVTDVPDNTLTTIATFTATTTTTLISSIKCSGTDNGKWQIFIDSVLKGTLRGGGGNRNVIFDFDGPLELDSGSVLDVKVTHFVQNPTNKGDFQAGIYGSE